MVMQEGERKIVWEVNPENAERAAEALGRLRENVGGLKEQMAALKEEPLQLEVEGDLPKPSVKQEEKEEEGERKSKKKEEKESITRVSGMISSGLVQGFKSGDVKGALADLGASMATTAATTLVSKGINSILSAIPGLGLITSFLGFQSEGLVTRPTLAMVGEHEPEFVVTQERMRALLSGGRPGYGFGPGDFGAPNVSVGSPNVNVEVSVAPGVDADIQTAYRARAGEARLSQLEG
jgi:regulator of replication initiation timing